MNVRNLFLLVFAFLLAGALVLPGFAETPKAKSDAGKSVKTKKAADTVKKEVNKTKDAVKKPARAAETGKKKETKKTPEATTKSNDKKPVEASNAKEEKKTPEAGKKGEARKPAEVKAPPKPKKEDAQKYYNEGVKLFKKKQYQAAVGPFDKAIEANDGFVKAYSLRGLCYYFLENQNKALADLNMALQFDPENVTALFGRGLANLFIGKSQEAIIDFSAVLTHQPQNALSYLERGICHYRLGNTQMAISDASRSISNNPKKAAPFVLRGVAYVKEDKFEPATRDFKMAASLEPDNPYYQLLAYTSKARGGDTNAQELRTYLDGKAGKENSFPYNLLAMMLGRKSPPECLKAAESFQPTHLRGTILQQTQFFVAQYFAISGDEEKSRKYLDLAMKGENKLFIIQGLVKLQYYDLQ